MASKNATVKDQAFYRRPNSVDLSEDLKRWARAYPFTSWKRLDTSTWNFYYRRTEQGLAHRDPRKSSRPLDKYEKYAERSSTLASRSRVRSFATLTEPEKIWLYNKRLGITNLALSYSLGIDDTTCHRLQTENPNPKYNKMRAQLLGLWDIEPTLKLTRAEIVDIYFRRYKQNTTEFTALLGMTKGDWKHLKDTGNIEFAIEIFENPAPMN